MPLVLPSFLALRRSIFERRDAIIDLIVRTLHPAPSEAGFAVQSFAFKGDEYAFAQALLRKKTELWLFRSNQRAFCGDFVVVDLSSPSPARRRAFVLDLKLNAKLRIGGGGAGVQLRNAERVIRDIAATGVLGKDPRYELMTGGSEEVLRFFGA
jgi:hypothetical protein